MRYGVPDNTVLSGRISDVVGRSRGDTNRDSV